MIILISIYLSIIYCVIYSNNALNSIKYYKDNFLIVSILIILTIISYFFIKNDFKSHQEFWIPKIERNMERDREVTQRLEAEGWTDLRFWGKDIKQNVAKCADEITAVILKK